jgi:hypothetical protein
LKQLNSQTVCHRTNLKVLLVDWWGMRSTLQRIVWPIGKRHDNLIAKVKDFAGHLKSRPKFPLPKNGSTPASI